MSAYTTGHKSCVNALGVYCASNRARSAHPNVETIAELAQAAAGAGGRHRHQHRNRGCDARRHGRAHPPAHRLRRHRAHVLLRCSPKSSWAAARANFLPAATRRQAQGRRELHRQVRGGRLRLRRNGDGSLRAPPPEPETKKLLGLFNRREHRRRARPQVPEEGHRRAIPRPARSRRRDARGAGRSVARAERASC